MDTGVPSICCELALLTSTLGCQTTLPRGGCTVEVQGCPCLEPWQPAPPTPSQVLPLPPRPSLPPPLLAPLPASRLSTHQGTGHTAPGSAGTSALSWGPRSPGCLGPSIHPSQQLQTLGGTEYSLGSHPQFTLNTFSFFSLYLLEFSEMSF